MGSRAAQCRERGGGSRGHATSIHDPHAPGQRWGLDDCSVAARDSTQHALEGKDAVQEEKPETARRSGAHWRRGKTGCRCGTDQTWPGRGQGERRGVLQRAVQRRRIRFVCPTRRSAADRGNREHSGCTVASQRHSDGAQRMAQRFPLPLLAWCRFAGRSQRRVGAVPGDRLHHPVACSSFCLRNCLQVYSPVSNPLHWCAGDGSHLETSLRALRRSIDDAWS